MRVLLVEDEKYTAKALAEILKKNNYAVDMVHDGEDGLAYALTDVYDVIILDIMLPKRDGLSVLKEMRDHHLDTPVILLTAKWELDDKVKGLDLGADDYLPKPFHTAELLARLRALQRRRPELLNDGILSCGDLHLAPHLLTLTCNEIDVKLTPKEARLLELLINRRNNVVPKNIIIEKVWGFDALVGDNHVETHISRLRKILERLGSKTTITTIRSVGYTLMEERDAREDALETPQSNTPS